MDTEVARLLALGLGSAEGCVLISDMRALPMPCTHVADSARKLLLFWGSGTGSCLAVFLSCTQCQAQNTEHSTSTAAWGGVWLAAGKSVQGLGGHRTQATTHLWRLGCGPEEHNTQILFDAGCCKGFGVHQG